MSSISHHFELGQLDHSLKPHLRAGRLVRCRKAIGAGELRIGIEAPEDDHRGSQLGWYHPSCLVSGDMGVSINGGTPMAGWFIRENPNLKLMI